jgi:hypothetical protein
MSKNANVNVVIYSHESKNCRNLLHMMQNSGIINLFRHIDISAPGMRIPDGITQIPTLIVANISDPLIGEHAFKWVNDTRRWKEQNERMKSMMTNNIYNWHMIKSNNSETEENKGLLPYEENTMSSFSDKFCLMKDDILPQNHVGISESIRIYTAPEEDKKISKDIQDKLIKTELGKRQEQDVFYKKSMDIIIDKAKNGELEPPQFPIDRLLDDVNKQQTKNIPPPEIRPIASQQNPQQSMFRPMPPSMPQLIPQQSMHQQSMHQQLMPQQLMHRQSIPQLIPRSISQLMPQQKQQLMPRSMPPSMSQQKQQLMQQKLIQQQNQMIMQQYPGMKRTK